MTCRVTAVEVSPKHSLAGNVMQPFISDPKSAFHSALQLGRALSALTDGKPAASLSRKFSACKEFGTVDHQDDQTLVSLQQMV